MCSSPKLFAAYHVLHRLIVPRHPSCALSSLTTKKTFAPGTLPHSGLSLLLFLSTKKLFLFLQILFQDTFFDCQSTPRSPAALPLLPQRKSFLIKSVCRIGGFVGESFSLTPPFPLCAGLSFPVGCALSVRGGGSAALLVRLRRPTPHHPLRGCAGGGFAALRSPSSLSFLAARFGDRRTVQSVHIRSAAHTALFYRATKQSEPS